MEYKLKIEESFYDSKEVTVVKFDVGLVLEFFDINENTFISWWIMLILYQQHLKVFLYVQLLKFLLTFAIQSKMFTI